MTYLREKAIKLVEEMPEEHLDSVVGVLQNLKKMTGEKPQKKRVDWKEIIEKYSGSVDCFKDIDVEAYIRESRGYDRV